MSKTVQVEVDDILDLVIAIHGGAASNSMVLGALAEWVKYAEWRPVLHRMILEAPDLYEDEDFSEWRQAVEDFSQQYIKPLITPASSDNLEGEE